VNKQYSDFEVIQKVCSGEPALFEILIRRYNPVLYKVGRSYNYSHEDTQDLMQDTFIDAFTSLSKFENRSSFKTWIVRIMLNNCFRRQQRSSFKNEVHSDTINEKSIPMYSSNHRADTNKAVINRELKQVIEQSLSHVPEEYRMVFSLREIVGLSTQETSEALNLTEANVKVRLNRAKSMLRKEIETHYTAEDIYEFNLVYCDAMVKNVMDKIMTMATNKA
jgi:RNA polymerase sigma factor (sigma-70 family)